MTPEMLTVREAAEALRVTPRTVHRMMRDGRLDAVWLSSRAIRISHASVLKLLTGTDKSGTVKT